MSHQDSDSEDSRLIMDLSDPVSEAETEVETVAVPVVQPVVQQPVVQPVVQPLMHIQGVPYRLVPYIYSSDTATSPESPVIIYYQGVPYICPSDPAKCPESCVITTVLNCPNEDCDYESTNRIDFDDHIANVHDQFINPKNSWVCPKPDCKFRYIERIDLDNHVERIHPISTKRSPKKRKT